MRTSVLTTASAIAVGIATAENDIAVRTPLFESRTKNLTVPDSVRCDTPSLGVDFDTLATRANRFDVGDPSRTHVTTCRTRGDGNTKARAGRHRRRERRRRGLSVWALGVVSLL